MLLEDARTEAAAAAMALVIVAVAKVLEMARLVLGAVLVVMVVDNYVVEVA